MASVALAMNDRSACMMHIYCKSRLSQPFFGRQIVSHMRRLVNNVIKQWQLRYGCGAQILPFATQSLPIAP